MCLSWPPCKINNSINKWNIKWCERKWAPPSTILSHRCHRSTHTHTPPSPPPLFLLFIATEALALPKKSFPSPWKENSSFISRPASRLSQKAEPQSIHLIWTFLYYATRRWNISKACNVCFGQRRRKLSRVLSRKHKLFILLLLLILI